MNRKKSSDRSDRDSPSGVVDQERPVFWGRDNSLLDTGARLAEIANRAPIFFYWVGFAALLASAFVASQGGLVHPEAEQYIPHYLSDAPMLQKVFDFKQVEIGLIYRPRPLSYMVDNLDVGFIRWSVRKGHPHFESLSYFVFWIGDSILLWFCFRKLFALDRLSSGLLVGLISTTPTLYLYTYYFRSAKPGAVFFMLIAFIAVVACYRAAQERKSFVRIFAASSCAFVFLLAACLFDEIPVAFSLAGAMVLALEAVLNWKTERSRAAIFCIVPIVLVLGSFAVYDVYIHALLVKLITGETLLTTFQSSFVSSLATQPLIHFVGTISVFTEVFGFLAGGISGGLSLAVMIFLLWFWLRFYGKTPAKEVGFGGVMMFVVLFGMISRHPPLMRFGVRQGLYVLPLLFVFLLFTALSSQKLLEKELVSSGRLSLVFFVLFVSNLSCLSHEWKFGSEDQNSLKEYSQSMIVALRSPNGITDAMLNDPKRGSFFQDVEKSPVYRSLRNTGQPPGKR